MGYDDEYYERDAQHDSGVTLNTEIEIGWNRGAILQGVIKQVSGMIYDDIKPQASDALKTALNDLANKAMTEMFETGIQPTDKWGDPKGDTITIRALLQRDAKAWLMDVVDDDGRKGQRAYGAQLPRIHWLFKEALNGQKDRRGKTELQKLVLKAVKEVVGDVEALVAETVRANVQKALGVK